MLTGTGLGAVVFFHAACRFFSAAVWDVDRLGLVLARLIVDRLLDPQAPITVVVDDTLFRRWGKRVHHALKDPRRISAGPGQDRPGQPVDYRRKK